MATAGATLRAEGRMPSLDGATGWLNSEPLTPAALRGRVVLVQFWTYTCINWLRTLAHVRAWHERYRDAGLVVLGVHTPEFSFERDLRNVRRAVQSMRIGYPVAIDSDYAVWGAFANHYWPALYFVDAEGRIRHHQFGEGDFEESELVLQQLLTEAGSHVAGQPLVRVAPTGPEAAADWDDLRSGETYLGYGRTGDFASPEELAPDVRRSYSLPASLRLNHWALAGRWSVRSEAAILEEAGGRIAYRFSARPAPRAGPGAVGNVDPVPRAPRRRATAGRRGGRRRRERRRRGHRPAAVPADPAAAADRRPDVRDRVRRAGGRRRRLHLRLTSEDACSSAWWDWAGWAPTSSGA